MRSVRLFSVLLGILLSFFVFWQNTTEEEYSLYEKKSRNLNNDKAKRI